LKRLKQHTDTQHTNTQHTNTPGNVVIWQNNLSIRKGIGVSLEICTTMA
jgi:hypothetical protein